MTSKSTRVVPVCRNSRAVLCPLMTSVNGAKVSVADYLALNLFALGNVPSAAREGVKVFSYYTFDSISFSSPPDFFFVFNH